MSLGTSGAGQGRARVGPRAGRGRARVGSGSGQGRVRAGTRSGHGLAMVVSGLRSGQGQGRARGGSVLGKGLVRAGPGPGHGRAAVGPMSGWARWPGSGQGRVRVGPLPGHSQVGVLSLSGQGQARVGPSSKHGTFVQNIGHHLLQKIDKVPRGHKRQRHFIEKWHQTLGIKAKDHSSKNRESGTCITANDLGPKNGTFSENKSYHRLRNIGKVPREYKGE